MAGLFALNSRIAATLRCLVLAGCAGSCLTARGEGTMMGMQATNAASATPPATNTVVVPKAPTTNAPTAAKPPVPDTLGRYGTILLPGNEVSHPLKLKMPWPGAGEVKVPKPGELEMREKLEQLATLSDDEIRKELIAWPAFSNMSLHDEGVMLQRIQDFRNYRGGQAAQKAHDLGLLTLTPEQKLKFEKEFWDKRLKMDQELAKQFRPIYQGREQKLEDELFREFSSASPGPAAAVPKAAQIPTTNTVIAPKPPESATNKAVFNAPLPAAAGPPPMR